MCLDAEGPPRPSLGQLWMGALNLCHQSSGKAGFFCFCFCLLVSDASLHWLATNCWTKHQPELLGFNTSNHTCQKSKRGILAVVGMDNGWAGSQLAVHSVVARKWSKSAHSQSSLKGEIKHHLLALLVLGCPNAFFFFIVHTLELT